MPELLDRLLIRTAVYKRYQMRHASVDARGRCSPSELGDTDRSIVEEFLEHEVEHDAKAFVLLRLDLLEAEIMSHGHDFLRVLRR
jgi:hypothetical protein